jgi:hypothetical protein
MINITETTKPNEALMQARTVLDQWRQVVQSGDVQSQHLVEHVDRALCVLAGAAGIEPHTEEETRFIPLSELMKEWGRGASKNRKTAEVPATPTVRQAAGVSATTPAGKPQKAKVQEAAPAPVTRAKVPASAPAAQSVPKVASSGGLKPAPKKVLPRGLKSGEDVVVWSGKDEDLAEQGILVSEYVTGGKVTVNVMPQSDEDDGLREVPVEWVSPDLDSQEASESQESEAPVGAQRRVLKAQPKEEEVEEGGEGEEESPEEEVEEGEEEPTTVEDGATEATQWMLRALWAASKVNAHEFGITDRLQLPRMVPAVRATIIAALNRQKLIEVADEIAPGVVQFVFTPRGQRLFKNFQSSPDLKAAPVGAKEITMPRKSTKPVDEVETDEEDEGGTTATAAPKRRGAAAKPAAAKPAKATEDNGVKGFEREHDLPWGDKKVKLFQVLRTLKATNAQNAKGSGEVAEASGGVLSARDVRHYAYAARAGGFIELVRMEGQSGYGFYLTQTGRAIDPVKELKKQEAAK